MRILITMLMMMAIAMVNEYDDDGMQLYNQLVFSTIRIYIPT